ncbi:hypothetical protein [Streptomyces hokutonensis]|nr:hypothetical protein [Streptomyces hokutonensis]
MPPAPRKKADRPACAAATSASVLSLTVAKHAPTAVSAHRRSAFPYGSGR